MRSCMSAGDTAELTPGWTGRSKSTPLACSTSFFAYSGKALSNHACNTPTCTLRNRAGAVPWPV